VQIPATTVDVMAMIAGTGNGSGQLGGVALNGDHTHTRCDIAMGSKFFNEPGR
jgi:hypothetical protein